MSTDPYHARLTKEIVSIVDLRSFVIYIAHATANCRNRGTLMSL